MTARTEVGLKELNRWDSQLREAPFLQGMEVGEPDRRGTAVKTMMSNRAHKTRAQPAENGFEPPRR